MKNWRDLGWAVIIFMVLGTGLTACAGAMTGGLFGAGLGMGLSVLLMVIGLSTTQTACNDSDVGPCLQPLIDMGPCLGAPMDHSVGPDTTATDGVSDSDPVDIGPCLGAPLDIGPCLSQAWDMGAPDAEPDVAPPLDVGPCLSDLGPDAPVDIGPCLGAPLDMMELDSTGDQSSIEATPETSRGAILARLIADDKLPQDVAEEPG
jgi:hypothetical protein